MYNFDNYVQDYTTSGTSLKIQLQKISLLHDEIEVLTLNSSLSEMKFEYWLEGSVQLVTGVYYAELKPEGTQIKTNGVTARR